MKDTVKCIYDLKQGETVTIERSRRYVADLCKTVSSLTGHKYSLEVLHNCVKVCRMTDKEVQKKSVEILKNRRILEQYIIENIKNLHILQINDKKIGIIRLKKLADASGVGFTYQYDPVAKTATISPLGTVSAPRTTTAVTAPKDGPWNEVFTGRTSVEYDARMELFGKWGLRNNIRVITLRAPNGMEKSFDFNNVWIDYQSGHYYEYGRDVSENNRNMLGWFIQNCGGWPIDKDGNFIDLDVNVYVSPNIDPEHINVDSWEDAIRAMNNDDLASYDWLAICTRWLNEAKTMQEHGETHRVIKGLRAALAGRGVKTSQWDDKIERLCIDGVRRFA